MAQVRAKLVQQGREEVCAALQCAASFYCMVEEWKVSEELNSLVPQPKKSGTLWTSKREETLCRGQQVPMHEMWNRQYAHEDPRKVYWDEISVQESVKMESATYGRTRCGKKIGQAGRSFDLVQKMLALLRDREWDQN